MGNCLSNTANFGSKTTQDRAEEAEKGAGQTAQTLTSGHKSLKCVICWSYVGVSINPWQQTRSDILAAGISDNPEPALEADIETAVVETSTTGAARTDKGQPRLTKRGLELKPCKHVFCGACLAQSIYRNLDVPFDTSTYGMKLRPAEPAPFDKKLKFPMGCPACQVRPGEKMNAINDMSARLVLGEVNMNEWNHARFLSKLDIIFCPHKGCSEPFDANSVTPARSGGPMQCPKCRKTLCKNCRVVWHEKRSCKEFQALSVNERAPEDLAFLELAEQKKWKRCPKCKAMVELKYGCNHITCTCKHHFCYTCGGDFQYKKGKYRCKSGKSCKVWDENMLLEGH